MATKAKKAIEPAVATTGIDHVVLHVSDLRRSIGFYTDVLGMTEHHGGSGYMFLRCGAQVLGLFETDDGEAVTAGPELNHIAFNAAPDSYEDVKAALERHGIEVRGRRGDPRCVYFRDPDGHQLQINVR
jgi:catechol 2,3-dioxygenase-like lactoylglutathione lyase family enzyme